LRKNEICGFRQVSEHKDEIELTLYYNEAIPKTGRMLFQALFERFLEHWDAKIICYEVVICSNPDCKERQEHSSVKKRMERQRHEIFCSNCGAEIKIPETTELTPDTITTELTEVTSMNVENEKKVVLRRNQFETGLFRVKAILLTL